MSAALKYPFTSNSINQFPLAVLEYLPVLNPQHSREVKNILQLMLRPPKMDEDRQPPILQKYPPRNKRQELETDPVNLTL